MVLGAQTPGLSRGEEVKPVGWSIALLIVWFVVFWVGVRLGG